MRTFSKSKLMALRQCPKRLWLEIHQPHLCENSVSTMASFKVGHSVGEVARRIYDPENRGALIDIEKEGFEGAFSRSKKLLQSSIPIFEAGFSAAGALAFADVMLPDDEDGIRAWRMIEVKSSSTIKRHFRDDLAIQAFVAKEAGVLLKSVSLAHIDTSWIYQGDGNYQGLLKENNLTEEMSAREDEVKSWIAKAQEIASQPSEPAIVIGSHCNVPYACGFYAYCSQPKAEYPVKWLPHIRASMVEKLAHQGIYDLREVPDELLNDSQRMVKEVSVTNKAYFYKFALSAILSNLNFPLYFLDFETIMFAVPIWKGTRPYQQNPFQFSLHKLTENGELTHTEFLDITGNNPAEGFADALINACEQDGDIIVYNSAFEMSRIRELADKFTHLSSRLLSINNRVEDLYPIAREFYYHPSQQGSWSLKKLLSAVVPELRYDALEGVQDGNLAMAAFMEAIDPTTDVERKEQIEYQLLAYCKLDTYALVRLWQVLSGEEEMKL